MDLNIFKTNPKRLNANSKIGIHSGFAGYLFGCTKEGISKFDRIINILKQLYQVNDPITKRDYRDYDLYITGHSLGGALTQLLAFSIASTLEATGLPTKTVNAISYASPRVGNYYYQKAFEELEMKGILRHIRVSNKHDVVAVAPSIGYYQTGINLHVVPEKKMKVGYLKDRKMLTQTTLFSASKHSLESYHERLFHHKNEKHLKMTVEELYSKYAKDMNSKSDKSIYCKYTSVSLSEKEKSRSMVYLVRIAHCILLYKVLSIMVS